MSLIYEIRNFINNVLTGFGRRRYDWLRKIEAWEMEEEDEDIRRMAKALREAAGYICFLEAYSSGRMSPARGRLRFGLQSDVRDLLGVDHGATDVLRKGTDTAEIRGALVSAIRDLGSVPVIRLARVKREPAMLSVSAEKIWALLWEYIANENSCESYSAEMAEHLCESVLPEVWDQVIWGEKSNQDLIADIAKIHAFQHDGRMTAKWWGRSVVDWIIDYAGRLEDDLKHALIHKERVECRKMYCYEDELPCHPTSELYAASIVDGVRLYPWSAVAAALKKEKEKLQAELSEAADEIHCAGTLTHRIRVLKKEHAAEIERLEGRLSDGG